MEDTLKRLLSVETKAEQLVSTMQAQREDIIKQALQEAHQAEQHFQESIPSIKAHFLEKAEERATQSIAELSQRYGERQARLRVLAEDNQQNALKAAVQLLVEIGS